MSKTPAKNNKWPPQKTAELAALAAAGHCRRDIAARMNAVIQSVTAKLMVLGLVVPLDPPEDSRSKGRSKKAPGRFAASLRFEDVTRAEAAAIAKGAPASAPCPRSHTYSLHGNAGRKCAP